MLNIPISEVVRIHGGIYDKAVGLSALAKVTRANKKDEAGQTPTTARVERVTRVHDAVLVEDFGKTKIEEIDSASAEELAWLETLHHS